MIEVAGADAHPIVDRDHLQVQEARLVFVDAHAGAQQARVALPA